MPESRKESTMDDLPTFVGLCPDHAPHFYMPLSELRPTTCPEDCPHELVIYVPAVVTDEMIEVVPVDEVEAARAGTKGRQARIVQLEGEVERLRAGWERSTANLLRSQQEVERLRGEFDRVNVRAFEHRAEIERLHRTVNLLRAGARDIAGGDYANAPARSFALRMLADTDSNA